MDERLRQLERRAQSRTTEDICNYVRALMHVGEGLRFIHGFQSTPTENIRDFLASSPLVQVACLGYGDEAVQVLLRDYFLKMAAETGVWHGILPLQEEQISYYNSAITNGFFNQPPHPDVDDRRNEDWRADQCEAIYTYYRGLPEPIYMPGQEGMMINPATWVELDCKLGEARLAVVWHNSGEYIPDWDGISFEDAKVAGPPAQILGSYRLVTSDYYPNTMDMPELDEELHGAGDENTHNIPDGTFEIKYCPEMRLHVVRCV